jgi:hypothetical protein
MIQVKSQRKPRYLPPPNLEFNYNCVFITTLHLNVLDFLEYEVSSITVTYVACHCILDWQWSSPTE